MCMSEICNFSDSFRFDVHLLKCEKKGSFLFFGFVTSRFKWTSEPHEHWWWWCLFYPLARFVILHFFCLLTTISVFKVCFCASSAVWYMFRWGFLHVTGAHIKHFLMTSTFVLHWRCVAVILLITVVCSCQLGVTFVHGFNFCSICVAAVSSVS